MDIKDIIQAMLSSAHILQHPDFIDEFLGLIVGTGQEKRVVTKLITKLQMISDLGLSLYTNQEFEHLSGHPNLYSLHIETGNLNIRILYCYVLRKQVWLHAYFERSGKKVTEYESHIPTANRRMREFKNRR